MPTTPSLHLSFRMFVVRAAFGRTNKHLGPLVVFVLRIQQWTQLQLSDRAQTGGASGALTWRFYMTQAMPLQSVAATVRMASGIIMRNVAGVNSNRANGCCTCKRSCNGMPQTPGLRLGSRRHPNQVPKRNLLLLTEISAPAEPD